MDGLLVFVGIIVTAVKGSYIENYRYLGCFVEQASNRAVPDHQLTSGSSLTIESCISHCQSYGSRYAALQKGIKCFCGNDGVSYDEHGQAPESDCDEVCSGDASQICGGNFRNTLFDIWDYLTTLSPSTQTYQPTTEPTTTITTSPFQEFSTTEATLEQTETMTTIIFQQVSTDQSTTMQNGVLKRHNAFTKVANGECIGLIDTTIGTQPSRSKRDCSRYCVTDNACYSFDFITQDDGTYLCRLQGSTSGSGLRAEVDCAFYLASNLV